MNSDWFVSYSIGFAFGFACFLLYLFVVFEVNRRRYKHMARAWEEGRASQLRFADNPYREKGKS